MARFGAEVVKQRLADLLKVTADTANPRGKRVVMGIHHAAGALIQFHRTWPIDST